MGWFLPPKQLLQQGKDVPLERWLFPPLADNQRTAPGQDGSVGPDADKGVAAYLFPAFHRFEQKRLGLVGRQAQKGRNRRFQVSRQGTIDRNQGMAGGQLQELRSRGKDRSIDRHSCSY